MGWQALVGMALGAWEGKEAKNGTGGADNEKGQTKGPLFALGTVVPDV